MRARGLVVLIVIALSGAAVRAVPPPPTNLTAQVSGTTVTLFWNAPAGASVSGYVVEAGTAPGLSNVTSIPVGPTPQVVATNVPIATYYVRVRAIDAQGQSEPSNEIVVIVGGTCNPPAASGLDATVTGSLVVLTWNPAAALDYVIEVGSGPGITNLAQFVVPTNSMPASAPDGVYFVRVRARDACGIGAPSNEIVVNVPGGDVPIVPRVERITTFKNGGGRLDWSPYDVIAFDQLGADNYFDLFTANLDGSGEKCLTCGRSELPNRHIGNPSWHPSGEFIVFQVQKANAPFNPIADYFANPGSGIGNDLWITDREGTRFWRLTDIAVQNGVLHPHFSPLGDQLFWSERVSTAGGPIGEWAMHVADFRIVSGVPTIENVRRYQPGAQRRFYESHGFTPDARTLLFSGNLEPGASESVGDIYLFTPESGALLNLTASSDAWDEHAHISPSGNWIVWMTSMGPGGTIAGPKSDYWLMRADGSAKTQLTFFNDRNHPDYIPGGATAADIAWSPDGTRLMAYLILDLVRGTARTVLIDLAGCC